MIKVGYLISYDYYLIFNSINQLYNYVDEIYLAIDKNRLTWSGNKFKLPDSFFDEIERFDSKKKIKIYFDDFYQKDLSPIECDTRERIMLSKKMGKGWLIQVDVDEYIYGFEKIVDYLKKHWYLLIFPRLTPVVFRAKWITLYKQMSDGFLYVKNNETFPLITNISHYQYCRENKKISNYQTNLEVIHQSWARSEEEVSTKLENWSHRNDFDTTKYFEFWKTLNSDNYARHKNIHPIVPEIWDELHFLKSNSIEEFIRDYSSKNQQILNSLPTKKIIKSTIKKLIGRK